MSGTTSAPRAAVEAIALAITPSEQAAIHRGWFKGLPTVAQQALLARARPRRLLGGEALAQHGVAREDWFAVCSGSVRLSGLFESGKPFTLDFLHAGDWCGQLSHDESAPQMNEAIAQTDCTVLVVRCDAMNALVHQHPALLHALLHVSYARLGEMMRFLEELQTLPLATRLARKIESLTQREHGDPAVLKLSQQDWADLLCASRPRINGHLRAMARDGVIRIEHRSLRVLEPGRLQALTGRRAAVAA